MKRIVYVILSIMGGLCAMIPDIVAQSRGDEFDCYVCHSIEISSMSSAPYHILYLYHPSKTFVSRMLGGFEAGHYYTYGDTILLYPEVVSSFDGLRVLESTSLSDGCEPYVLLQCDDGILQPYCVMENFECPEMSEISGEELHQRLIKMLTVDENKTTWRWYKLLKSDLPEPDN